MEIKKVSPGDKVEIKTKTKTWIGNIIESYEYEITLLKLESGYNIGIRNSEIIDVNILEKVKKEKEKKEIKENNKKLRNIGMIVTGGTISSRLDTKTGAVKWTTIDDLFKIAPELQEICNISEIKSPFMKGSEDMSLKDWKIIAEEAHKMLENKDIDGVIVTHGTDTLHYGAAALSFFIQNLNKPIAFTYSQRSIDRASTDAHLNLICAAKYAVSDIAEVAVIGHNNSSDSKCYALKGTKCRKMHSSRRDAFKPINSLPIATISKEHLEITDTFNARSDNKPKLDTKYSERVAVIKYTPGMDPKVLEWYAEEGYKGIIIETLGLGQIGGKESSKNMIPTIKRLIIKGIIICATAQTIEGSLNPKVYSTGRELEKTGLLYLKDMTSETAFIKLSWILGHKSWAYNDKSAPEKMLKNFVGEFNDRLPTEP